MLCPRCLCSQGRDRLSHLVTSPPGLRGNSESLWPLVCRRWGWGNQAVQREWLPQVYSLSKLFSEHKYAAPEKKPRPLQRKEVRKKEAKQEEIFLGLLNTRDNSGQVERWTCHLMLAVDQKTSLMQLMTPQTVTNFKQGGSFLVTVASLKMCSVRYNVKIMLWLAERNFLCYKLGELELQQKHFCLFWVTTQLF